jgi:hypothetical protein
MSQGSVMWRVMGVILLILVVAVGGFFVYQAGYSQGIAHSAAAAAVSTGQTAAAPVPLPYPYYGYYPGPWFSPFFFPFGCLFGFFLIGLFFFGLRMLFFPRWHGRRGWRHHGYGPWGGQWDEGEADQKPGQSPGQSGPTRTS